MQVEVTNFNTMQRAATRCNELVEIWIKTQQAVIITGVNRSSLHRNLNYVKKSTTGKTGKETLWLLSSFPVEAQEKYFSSQLNTTEQSGPIMGGSIIRTETSNEPPIFFQDMASIPQNKVTNSEGDDTKAIEGVLLPSFSYENRIIDENVCEPYNLKQGGNPNCINNTALISLENIEKSNNNLVSHSNNYPGGAELRNITHNKTDLLFSGHNEILKQVQDDDNIIDVKPNNAENIADIWHGNLPLYKTNGAGSLINSHEAASSSFFLDQRAKEIALARVAVLEKWNNYRYSIEISSKNMVTECNETSAKKVRNCEKDLELGRILKLTKSIKIDLCEIQRILEISYTEVRNRIQSNEYRVDIEKSRGRGGKKYLIHLSCLPVEVQVRYFEEVLLKDPIISKMVEDEFENREGNKQSLSKKQADEEFVAVYNSKFYAKLYEITGDISKGTLFRWQKLYNITGDWKELAPGYSYNNISADNSGLTEDEKQAFLSLLLKPAKIEVDVAYRYTINHLRTLGFDDLSSINAYRKYAKWYQENNNHVWTLAREGRKALVDKVIPYNKRDISVLEVGDCFVADGHTLDFQVINPFTGKACRATMVAFLDWKSRYICGFEIMVSENTQCVASALRAGIMVLGKMPKVVYIDNGKSFKNKFFKGIPEAYDFSEQMVGIYAQLGIQVAYAKPYNAQSKIIERFFRTFTSQFERLMPSYIGNNIENKPAWMMRNEKFHKAIHNEYVPTIDEASGYICQFLDFYGNQSHPEIKNRKIIEVFSEGRGSGVDVNLLDDLMMASETKTVRRNYIRFLKSDYIADELYGYSGKCVIKYSLFSLSTIKVFNMAGQFICEAKTQKSLHPLAAYLGDQFDMDAVKQANKSQRHKEKQTVKKLKSIMDNNKYKNVDRIMFGSKNEIPKQPEVKQIQKYFMFDSEEKLYGGKQ